MIKKVVIIGAGIGGLTAGAYLAQAGYQVTVLEKAVTAGGSAGWYLRGARRFPTGATIAFGLEGGGLLQSVLTPLSIKLPATMMDHPMNVILSDRTVSVYQNRDVWEQELQRVFHERADDVLLFWRELAALSEIVLKVTESRASLPIRKLVDLGNLPSYLVKNPVSILKLLRNVFSTVEDLLHRHKLTKYTPLREFLNAQLIDAVQTDLKHAALLPASAALDIYRNGSFAIEGGMGTISEQLARQIEMYGGQIYYSSPATSVTFHPSTKQWIVESRKHSDSYDVVIDNSGLSLANNKKIDSSEGWGAFRIDASLKIDALNHFQPLRTYEQLPFAYQIHLDEKKQQQIGVHGPLYVTLSQALNRKNEVVPEEITLTASVHVLAKEWADLDGVAYDLKKSQIHEALMLEINQLFSKLDDILIRAESGTPQTYLTYIGKSGVGGTPLTVKQAILFSKGPRTKFPGYYIAGEMVFPGPGTLSAALSGYYAARAVMNKKR